MEYNKFVNCHKKKVPSVTDIYYGRSLKLRESNSSHLWNKLSSIFYKSRNSSVHVKLFKDPVCPYQEYVCSERCSPIEAIRPTSNLQCCTSDDELGMAMGLEVRNLDSLDSLAITVELEPMLGEKECRSESSKNKPHMKLCERDPSKSVFTGVMTLPSNMDITQLAHIPLYIIDSNNQIVTRPRSKISYKTLVKGSENMDKCKSSDVKVKFEVEAVKSNCRKDRCTSSSSCSSCFNAACPKNYCKTKFESKSDYPCIKCKSSKTCITPKQAKTCTFYTTPQCNEYDDLNEPVCTERSRFKKEYLCEACSSLKSNCLPDCSQSTCKNGSTCKAWVTSNPAICPSEISCKSKPICPNSKKTSSCKTCESSVPSICASRRGSNLKGCSNSKWPVCKKRSACNKAWVTSNPSICPSQTHLNDPSHPICNQRYACAECVSTNARICPTENCNLNRRPKSKQPDCRQRPLCTESCSSCALICPIETCNVKRCPAKQPECKKRYLCSDCVSSCDLACPLETCNAKQYPKQKQPESKKRTLCMESVSSCAIVCPPKTCNEKRCLKSKLPVCKQESPCFIVPSNPVTLPPEKCSDLKRICKSKHAVNKERSSCNSSKPSPETYCFQPCPKQPACKKGSSCIEILVPNSSMSSPEKCNLKRCSKSKHAVNKGRSSCVEFVPSNSSICVPEKCNVKRCSKSKQAINKKRTSCVEFVSSTSSNCLPETCDWKQCNKSKDVVCKKRCSSNPSNCPSRTCSSLKQTCKPKQAVWQRQSSSEECVITNSRICPSETCNVKPRHHSKDPVCQNRCSSNPSNCASKTCSNLKQCPKPLVRKDSSCVIWVSSNPAFCQKHKRHFDTPNPSNCTSKTCNNSKKCPASNQKECKKCSYTELAPSKLTTLPPEKGSNLYACSKSRKASCKKRSSSKDATPSNSIVCEVENCNANRRAKSKHAVCEKRSSCIQFVSTEPSTCPAENCNLQRRPKPKHAVCEKRSSCIQFVSTEPSTCQAENCNLQRQPKPKHAVCKKRSSCIQFVAAEPSTCPAENCNLQRRPKSKHEVCEERSPCIKCVSSNPPCRTCSNSNQCSTSKQPVCRKRSSCVEFVLTEPTICPPNTCNFKRRHKSKETVCKNRSSSNPSKCSSKTCNNVHQYPKQPICKKRSSCAEFVSDCPSETCKPKRCHKSKEAVCEKGSECKAWSTSNHSICPSDTSCDLKLCPNSKHHVRRSSEIDTVSSNPILLPLEKCSKSRQCPKTKQASKKHNKSKEPVCKNQSSCAKYVSSKPPETSNTKQCPKLKQPVCKKRSSCVEFVLTEPSTCPAENCNMKRRPKSKQPKCKKRTCVEIDPPPCRPKKCSREVCEEKSSCVDCVSSQCSITPPITCNTKRCPKLNQPVCKKRSSCVEFAITEPTTCPPENCNMKRRPKSKRSKCKKRSSCVEIDPSTCRSQKCSQLEERHKSKRAVCEERSPCKSKQPVCKKQSSCIEFVESNSSTCAVENCNMNRRPKSKQLECREEFLCVESVSSDLLILPPERCSNLKRSSKSKCKKRSRFKKKCVAMKPSKNVIICQPENSCQLKQRSNSNEAKSKRTRHRDQTNNCSRIPKPTTGLYCRTSPPKKENLGSEHSFESCSTKSSKSKGQVCFDRPLSRRKRQSKLFKNKKKQAKCRSEECSYRNNDNTSTQYLVQCDYFRIPKLEETVQKTRVHERIDATTTEGHVECNYFEIPNSRKGEVVGTTRECTYSFRNSDGMSVEDLADYGFYPILNKEEAVLKKTECEFSLANTNSMSTPDFADYFSITNPKSAETVLKTTDYKSSFGDIRSTSILDLTECDYVKTPNSKTEETVHKGTECSDNLTIITKNTSTQYMIERDFLNHKEIDVQSSLFLAFLAMTTKMTPVPPKTFVQKGLNPFSIEEVSVSEESSYPRSVASTWDNNDSSVFSEASVFIDEINLDSPSSSQYRNALVRHPANTGKTGPSKRSGNKFFELVTVVDNGSQCDESSFTTENSSEASIKPDKTLELLEKARQKLSGYVRSTCSANFNRYFTDEELLNVCSLLRDGKLAKNFSLNKFANTASKKKKNDFFGFLEIDGLNGKEPYRIPLTEFQYRLLSSSRNASKIKSVKSLTNFINNDFLENMDNLNDVNAILCEEVLSLQLTNNEMWAEVVTIFDQLQISLTQNDLQEEDCPKLLENIGQDLSDLLCDLQQILKTFNGILASALIKELATNFEGLLLNRTSSTQLEVPHYTTPVDGASPISTNSTSSVNLCNNASPNDPNQPNDPNHPNDPNKPNDLDYSNVNKAYLEIEDDINKTIKQLLQECEDIKNTAILNGAFEEDEPPFYIDYLKELKEPNPLPICKTPFEESSVVNASDIPSTSTGANPKSYGDTFGDFRSDTKHIFDKILKQVENHSFNLRPCRCGQLNGELQDTEFSIGEKNTGKAYVASCSHVLQLDVQTTNKIADAKAKIDYKKTYFGKVLACRIPKTSFSFGGGNKQKCKDHFKSNLKTQGKRKCVLEGILNENANDPKTDFLNNISGKHIDVSGYEEQNFKICHCAIIENNENSPNENVSDNLDSNNNSNSNSHHDDEVAQEQFLNVQNLNDSPDNSTNNLVLQQNNGKETEETKENCLNVKNENVLEENSEPSCSLSSSNNSTVSDKEKIPKSQKRFKITGNFQSDMEENFPSTSTHNSEGCKEVVIHNFDLTQEDPNMPEVAEDEILMKVQNLENDLSKDLPSTEKNIPPPDDKQIKVIAIKPTNEANLSDCLLSDSIGPNFPSNTRIDFHTNSHVILRNVYAKTNIVEAQPVDSEESRLESATELEITFPPDSSSYTISEEFDANFEDSYSLEMRLNLPLNRYESIQELNSLEEIALIEENVRQNLLLDRRSLRSTHFSCENEYYIYADPEISDTSVPIILSRNSEET